MAQTNPAHAATVASAALAPANQLSLIDVLTTAEAAKAAGSPATAVSIYRQWLHQLPSDSPYLPMSHVAMFNLGVALGALADHAGAEQIYRQAIEHKPDFPEAHINLGTQVEAQGRRGEAIAIWQNVLEREYAADPSKRALLLHLLNNLGRALEIEKDYARAEAMLERSMRLSPAQPDVLQHWVHLRQKQCAWPWFKPVEGVTYASMARATSPLAMLAAFDDPAFQLYRASVFLQNKIDLSAAVKASSAPRAAEAASVSTSPTSTAGKIRIGYLSSDFCQHAVSMLTIELFELHDSSRFEIFAFSWTRDDGSPMRHRILRAMTEYVPIAHLDDDQAVDAIRTRGIDILIDLQGLTSGARPGILARRAAPVQITYLGLPGTTGMPFIDYVIADPFVLPPEMTPFFPEKPLYMPHCFQSSDRQRTPCAIPTRAESGLPDNGTVFCSFNNNYKFTDVLFACWMRILAQVPHSVLWLLADNEWARANMLATARSHGIDETRLVFAPRAHTALYFARYQVADLFLDTMPFNGGTTANDALWMGLPLLTCPGRTFASRMAGSLLNALGMPELIADDLKAYEALAIAIGRDTDRQRALKAKLAVARVESPVFQMDQFVRDLEQRLEALARPATATTSGAV